MKKILMLLIFGIVLSFAACGEEPQAQDCTSHTDENGDGKCDNCNATVDTPDEDDPTEDDPTEDDPTEDDPTEDDPTEDEPTEDEPTEDEPTENEPEHIHTPDVAKEENRVEPTCEAEGSYDEVVYCSECGEELSRTPNAIIKLDHIPDVAKEENRVEPTCEAEGSYDEVVYCSECGEELSRTPKAIIKLDHIPDVAKEENRVEPTCEAEGSYDEVVYCSECGEELSKTKKILPASHSYDNGKCTQCGELKPSRGLVMTLNDDGAGYTVSGIGTCIDDNVVIPGTYKGLPVTAIGDYAFNNRTNIRTVFIPEGVLSVGSGAFNDCSNLTSVSLPDSLEAIDHSLAFFDCTSLTYKVIDNAKYLGNEKNPYLMLVSATDKTVTSFTINENTKFIGESAFYNCTSLAEIFIPDKVTFIGEKAFYNCTSLLSAKLGKSVETIEPHAFSGCKVLSSVTIPDSIKTIGDYAFDKCNSLVYSDYNNAKYIGNEENPYVVLVKATSSYITSCTVHDDTKVIYNFAFQSSTLKNISLPEGLVSIGGSAFYGCKSLTAISIPDGVDSVGFNLFYNCEKLASVTLGKGVKTIGASAFYNCKALTSLVLPDGLVTINNSAFQNCSKLASISIPDSVRKVGIYAFSSCSTLQYNVYDNMRYLGCEENPYAVLVSAYDKTLTSCTVNSETKVIMPQAFSGCSKLESLTLPFIGHSKPGLYDTVQYPFGYIFATTNLAGGVETTQCYYAGGSYYSSASYYIPESLKHITVTDGNIVRGAFYNCGNIESVTILYDGDVHIGEYAFKNCSSLKNISIPDSIVSVNDKVLAYSVSEYAFAGCTSLEYNEYNGAYYLGNEDNPYAVLVMAKDTSITSCDIHSDTKVICPSAFWGCTSLKSITVPTGVVYLGYGAFGGCTSLESVTLPEGITKIGFMTFYNCGSLKSITLPASLTYIGSSVFSECYNIYYATVYYGGSEEQWREVAISTDNSNFTSATVHYGGTAE